MFSPIGQIEQRAICIILGVEGECPQNLNHLAFQLWPDLVGCSSPSSEKRVQSLKGILRQRSGSNPYSLYFVFYRRKRHNGRLDAQQCSPEDLAFLESVYEHCPSWLTLQDKIRTVLAGHSFKKMMRGKKEVPLPDPNL